MSEEVQSHILQKYSLVKKVGSGAYGHVWKVQEKSTGQILALKKIFDAFQHSTDAQRTYREIVFLHELNHPNIVKMHQVMKAKNDKDLYLVFEYMEADLHNAIGQKILQDVHNRYILHQLAKAIKYLHSAEVIHRDLKPSNVLLNSDCSVRICDFGLARSLAVNRVEDRDAVLTEQVATRWYRAPQVLLGSHTYGKPADMWSVGCIMGELLIGKPMFPGNSTLNQLERIVSFTGVPPKQDIYALNSEVALAMIDSLPSTKFKHDWFPSNTPVDAIKLIQSMLHFNPAKRITINQLLKSPYLVSFSDPKQQIQCKRPIVPPISDNKKLTMKQYRQLIYDRISRIYKSTDPSERQNSVHSITNHQNISTQSISYPLNTGGNNICSSVKKRIQNPTNYLYRNSCNSQPKNQKRHFSRDRDNQKYSYYRFSSQKSKAQGQDDGFQKKDRQYKKSSLKDLMRPKRQKQSIKSYQDVKVENSSASKFYSYKQAISRTNNYILASKQNRIQARHA